MSLISKFDPWCSKFCTCPPKLTFNPYTGCDHACTYCYASSYVPRFFDCRPKKNLVERLRKEAARLKGETLSMSNSSDPYPLLEGKAGMTRSCLEILSQHRCKIQIVTKSPLVTRDIDVLKRIPSMVCMTVTTQDDRTAKLIEPYAAPPSARLKAIKTLIGEKVPMSVRIDPVIPLVNDDLGGLMKTLASLGVKHVTSSTFKVRPDSWRRFGARLPEVAKELTRLYFQKGERHAGYYYLPKDLRLRLMERVGGLAKKYGIRFGTCREGLTHINTAACDGSWLLEEEFPRTV